MDYIADVVTEHTKRMLTTLKLYIDPLETDEALEVVHYLVRNDLPAQDPVVALARALVSEEAPTDPLLSELRQDVLLMRRLNDQTWYTYEDARALNAWWVGVGQTADALCSPSAGERYARLDPRPRGNSIGLGAHMTVFPRLLEYVTIALFSEDDPLRKNVLAMLAAETPATVAHVYACKDAFAFPPEVAGRVASAWDACDSFTRACIRESLDAMDLFIDYVRSFWRTV